MTLHIPRARPNQRTMAATKQFLDEHPDGPSTDELAAFVQGMSDEAVKARIEVLEKTRMRS